MNQLMVAIGDTPIKNWNSRHEDFDCDHGARLSPEDFAEPVVAKYHCHACLKMWASQS